MRKVVIVGSGGHAKVLIDILECANTATIVGLIDVPQRAGHSVLGHKVIGTDDDLPKLKANDVFDTVIIGIGSPKDRMRLHDRIVNVVPEATFETAIHPRATIAQDVKIGAGTSVMAGAVINPSCTIGDHCVINTCASVDHDCVIGDFANLSPNCCTGGNVRIDRAAHVGIGASIVQGIHIGMESQVGAGSVVVDDVPEHSTVMGVPARACS